MACSIQAFLACAYGGRLLVVRNEVDQSQKAAFVIGDTPMVQKYFKVRVKVLTAALKSSELTPLVHRNTTGNGTEPMSRVSRSPLVWTSIPRDLYALPSPSQAIQPPSTCTRTRTSMSFPNSIRSTKRALVEPIIISSAIRHNLRIKASPASAMRCSHCLLVNRHPAQMMCGYKPRPAQ